MKNSRGWQPLVSGEGAKRRVLARVTAILDELVELHGDQPIAPHLQGAAGIALALAYAEEDIPGRGYGEAAKTFLEGSIDSLATIPTPSLYHGFTGLAWVTEHLVETPLDAPPDSDPNGALDDVVAALVAVTPWPGQFDLVTGLVGYGVYALERGARPAAKAHLVQIVDRLAELVDRSTDGVALPTPDSLRRVPVGPAHYDLGVAHGAAGLVAFLALVAGVAPAARDLLPEAVRFLLSRGRTSMGAFGYSCGDVADLDLDPARTAWCYGAPGTAAALLLASKVAENPAWREAALTTALHDAARPRAATGVTDAGLCHGAAGVMHLFNRLHQAFGVEPLKEAALGWLSEAMSMARPGVGIGGYRTFDDVNQTWIESDPSFLTGSAGIAMALLATVSERAPNWDRLLLVSG